MKRLHPAVEQWKADIPKIAEFLLLLDIVSGHYNADDENNNSMNLRSAEGKPAISLQELNSC